MKINTFQKISKNNIFLIVGLALFLTLFQFSELYGQSTPQYYYEIPPTTKPTQEFIPLSDPNMGNRNSEYVSQWLYFPGDFGNSVPNNMEISAIYFQTLKPAVPVDYLEFTIALKQANINGLSSTTWETGLDTVLYSARYTVPASVQPNDWVKFELDNSFAFDPNLPLIIETSQKDVNSNGLILYGGGSPVNGAYSNAITQIYGNYGRPVPDSGRTNTYNFGFDLVAGAVANDVGVERLDSPAVFCDTGSYDVYATIKNYGTNEVDSVEVSWEVDGIPQGTIKYIGLLDSLRGTRGNSAMVFLGSYNLQSPIRIKIYTSMPNGVNDGNNGNDTLTKVVRPSFRGNYTVDPTTAPSLTNFISLTSLAEALNEVGVCGPTYINVANGRYNEVLSLKDIPGASEINHIVIDGNDSSRTIVSQNGSLAYATLSFEGTKHVHVKNMSFRMTGSEGVAVVFVNSEQDTISNCATWVQTISPASQVFNMLFSGSTSSSISGSSKYIVIQNNDIKGGYRGVFVNGNLDSLSPYNQFYYNNIDSAYFYGAFITYQDSLEFTGNNVNTYDSKGLDALTIENSNNFHIKQNYIYGNRRGLNVSTRTEYDSIPRGNYVINNMIYGRNSYPATYFGNIDSLHFWHNSIFAEGGIPALNIVNITNGIEIGGYDLRNNIFTSERGYVIRTQTHTSISDSMLFAKMDFNIYHRYNGIGLFYMNGMAYGTLADYQTTVTSLNLKSLEGDPEYRNLINPTDLHILGSFPSEKGDNSVGIIVDIDGEVRPGPTTINVDIGADEFYPLICYPPLNPDVSDVATDSATIKWEADTARSMAHQEFAYVIVPCDSSPYSVAPITTNLDSLRVGGLNPGTCYQLYVREVCDRGDSSSWIVPIKFYTAYVVPYGEDFESFPPGIEENPWPNGWTSTKAASLLPRWNSARGIPATQLNTGPAVDHTTGTDTGTYILLRTRFSATPPNDSADFITHKVYIDSSLASFELSYWYHAYGSGVHGMDVYIDTNGVRNRVGGFYGSQHTSRNDPWLKDSVLVSGYQGQYIQVVFRGRNGPNGNSNLGMIGIDDVAIKAGPSCPPPYNMVATPTTPSTVDLSWTSVGSAVTIEYGVKGFTRGNGTTVSGLTPPYTISGLQPNIIYEVYLQDSCDVLDQSILTSPFEFYTQSLNCDDFDQYRTGDLISQSSLFIGWDGDAGDAEVSSSEAYSPNNSLKIHDTGIARMSNVVADIGVHDSGVWVVKFDLLVPTGNSAHYKVLYDYKGNSSEEAFDVFLDSSGTAFIRGRTAIGTYNFVTNAWNTVEHVIDLDNDTTYVLINGEEAGIGWKFKSNIYIKGEQFNAVNFETSSSENYPSLAYYDNFCVSEYEPIPMYPIGTLNTTDNDGIPDSMNVTAWTEGHVAGVNLHPSNGLNFTLIDGSGTSQEGINVYADVDLRGFEVEEGDRIQVRGTVGLDHGLTQIKINAIVELNSTASLSAKPANNLDETTESQYIRMRNFVLIDSTQASANTYKIRAYNGSDTISIQIHENTEVFDSLASVGNTLIPGDTICVLEGIGGQYDTSKTAPFLSGYHITPMFFNDLQICKLAVGIDMNVSVKEELRFYPNPTNGHFTLEAHGLAYEKATIMIRDISGKVILVEDVANQNNSFKRSYNLEGQAKGLYLISIIDGQTKITRKLILQ